MNSKKFLSPEEIKKYAKDIEPFKTGFSAEEILGRNPGDMWGGNMPREFYEKMWDTIKNKKQPFAGEVLNKRKDGVETWQEIRILPTSTELGGVNASKRCPEMATALSRKEQEQQEK